MLHTWAVSVPNDKGTYIEKKTSAGYALNFFGPCVCVSDEVNRNHRFASVYLCWSSMVCVQENFSKHGLRALDLTSEFDEKLVLETNSEYLCNTLEVRNVLLCTPLPCCPCSYSYHDCWGQAAVACVTIQTQATAAYSNKGRPWQSGHTSCTHFQYHQHQSAFQYSSKAPQMCCH